MRLAPMWETVRGEVTVPLLVQQSEDQLPLHARGAEAVARELGSDLTYGLTSAEADERLRAVGPNRLEGPSRPRYLAIAGRQLADPLVVLLIAAALVSAGIGETVEAGVIAAIVVLNAILGFVQEAGAERAVLALGRSVEETVTVIRDGARERLFAEGLVPGDLVLLQEGDRVPADARVVTSAGLAVDESALTGESVPVSKSEEPALPSAPLAERTSLVFAGTGVTRGRASVLVVATAGSTEMGEVASLTASAKPPPTPLQRRLGGLSKKLALLGVALTIALTLGMLAQGSSFDEAFLVGVSVAVAAVPEGLAAVVTIALAQGARGMARRGAIVRSLSAIETLGEASVIATDKTGTLTLNELRIVDVEPAPGYSPDEVVGVGALASTGTPVEDGGALRVLGDPVDAAFVVEALERGLEGGGLERIGEIPFDPERKRAAAVYDADGRPRVAVKGAHEVLFELAGLPAAVRGPLERTALGWAERGLRVLAVAEGWPEGAGGEPDPEALERDLEILGIVALQDPLRETSAAAVQGARRAGIEVLMVTGDHPRTAASIARELDLGDAPPLTGPELDGMDDERLGRALEGHTVYARVAPAHKLRLVEALQGAGRVVAVTGDGINDAPALRRADAGVAMGRSGTEAARQAAEVVLTDDDFATIVAAVREGRIIGDNVRKFVAFLLSANLGEIVLFAVAVLAGLGAPMTVVQVLTVNLLTDGLPAIALTRDPASPTTMLRPPNPLGTLFSREQSLLLGAAGVTVGAAATVAFLAGRELEPDAAQTMAFATIALAELAFVYSIRSSTQPAWAGPANRALALSVLASAGVVLACVYVPFARELLGAEPLGTEELALVVVLALTPSFLIETGKVLVGRRKSR
jgi:Ca2+-transporting ATPase